MGSQNSSRRNRLQGSEALGNQGPFLSLPREIRDMIYPYALQSSSVYIHVINLLPSKPNPSRRARYTFSGRPTRYRTSALPLLLTCSQIYSEALLYFYSQNTFIFYPLTASLQHNQLALRMRYIGLQLNMGVATLEDANAAIAHFEVELATLRKGYWPELVSVTIRLVSNRKEVVELLSGWGWKAGALSRFKEIWRQDQRAWEVLLAGKVPQSAGFYLGGNGRKPIRRVLETRRVYEDDFEACAWGLRELEKGLKGEIWFYERYWDGRTRTHIESSMPATLPHYITDSAS